MKWKPIETAKKDGTELLLLSDEGIFQGKFNGSFWEPLSLEYHGYNCDIFCKEPEPTHWMELPCREVTKIKEDISEKCGNLVPDNSLQKD